MSRGDAGPGTGPPRLPWHLRFFGQWLPEAEWTALEAELRELYRHRLANRGEAAAALWLRRESRRATVGLIIAALPRPACGGALSSRLRGEAPHALDSTGGRGGAGVPGSAVIPRWLAGASEDVRYAARSLRRSPGVTAAAASTLALGIAAVTLIYAVVRGSVLRGPALPEARELVWVWPGGELPLTQQDFRDLAGEVSSAELTAFAGRAFTIMGGEAPEEVTGVAVSPNHFSVFGRPPAHGRGFTAADGEPGGEAVALIGHALWQSHFGGEESVIGRRVELYTAATIPMIPGAFEGRGHTVIGVLPPGYRPFGYPVDVVTALVADPADPAFSNMGELSVLGRLAGGWTPQRLRAELVAAAGRLPGWESQREAAATGSVIRLHEALTAHVRAGMFVTLGAVALVLLIACANVANIMLARNCSRQREFGMRAALGAERWRIARLIGAECLVLSIGATGLGLTLAWALLPALRAVLPHDLGISADAIRLDWAVFSVAAAALVGTALVSGVPPAIRYSRDGGVSRSREGVGGTRRGNRLNRGLVVGELALAAVLATGAGLLVKSLSRLTSVDAGFTAENVMTLRLAPAAREYADVEARRVLYRRLLDDTRGLRGVRSAGLIHFLPIADGGPSVNFLPDPADPDSRSSVGYRVISPGYLETMGIPLVAGRDLEASDREGGSPAGLVNAALAERLWPGQDPIGRTLYRTSGNEWFTVVGVTGNVRQAALGIAPRPEAYLPLEQSQWASAMTLVVKTDGPIAGLASTLEGVVAAIDPGIPVTRTAWLETILSDSIASPRFYGLLFSAFAALAIVLGGLGVYGVVSYIVRQRTDEIGIRLALGASRGRIMRLEVMQGAIMAAYGGLAGLAIAALGSRLLGSLLFEVSPFDPLVYSAAAGVLALVTVAGVLVPARRAARVDPIVSIRRD